MDVLASVHRQKAHVDHKLDEVAQAENRNETIWLRVRAKWSAAQASRNSGFLITLALGAGPSWTGTALRLAP